MPSMNQRTWLGVSTTNTQAAIHFVTEELRNLEESTSLLRESLISFPRDVQASPDVEDVTSFLEKRDQLKEKIQCVVKSNAEMKVEMKQYLQESEAWNEAFLIKSQEQDKEFKEVLEKGEKSGDVSPIKEQPKTNWCSIFGSIGRINAFVNLRNRWNAINFEGLFGIPNGPATYAMLSYF